MTSRQKPTNSIQRPGQKQPDHDGPVMPQVMTTQDAIYMLSARIKAIEQKFGLFMGEIERKFGENEAFVTDNIPDMDQFSTAIRDINTRLLDLNDLEGRITALEASTSNGVDPSGLAEEVATPMPVLSSSTKKKKGTVKLTDN
jgi:hypothetical protein